MKPLSIFILFLLSQIVKGQSSYVDSLRTEINQASNDIVRANLYIDLARAYKEISVDSSLLYFDQSTEYFDTSKATPLLTSYFYYHAEVLFEMGLHDRALQELEKAEKNPISDSFTREDLQVRKAQVYLRTGRYDQASQVLLAALPILEESNRKSTLASCYNGLGTVMQYNKRLDLALEYYQKAYQVNLEIGELHNAYGGLANIATLHSRNGNFARSKPAYRKVIAYCQGKNETHLEALAVGNLGMNYRDLNILDSAEHFISRSLDLHKSLKNERGVSQSSSMLAGVLLKRGKYRETIELALPQYYIAERQKNMRLQDRLAEKLAEAYKETGNYKESIVFVEKHAEIRDSLYQKEVADAVNDAQTKYETEKKEAEIRRLALEDQLNRESITRQRVALGGSIIGLGLLSLLLLRINGQKKKIESQSEVISRALEEKDTLLREIHHRVKNNLQVISSLLGLQSRSLEDKAAIDALTQSRSRVHSMSLIHQNLYQRDNLTGIQIKEYFEKLSASLINTYRISDDILIEAEIEDLLLDVDTVIPLGLILNELLTNSLKYAFPDQKGLINVQLGQRNDHLELVISDNGVGMDNPEQVLEGEGYGYELVNSLVEKLEGSIEVYSDNGTKVIMQFSQYQVLDS